MHALTLNSISKSYRLYKKPLDRLKEALFRKPYHQAFHALQEVSLSVSTGETLGIIGDNGAGKSTLLKILAGTLTQSSGELHVSGRISALLELGSGFHYEFTGRQNIWMNASLMGLKKKEILQWEDEIITFSELQAFIDRPLKTYSSGMVVRLAFSIATVVNPDILIIDEALSVGDQHFQKKCIDKMIEIKNRNKIILFCSHSLYLVNMLCDRAVWIDNGRVVDEGIAEQVTANYENYCRQKSANASLPDEGERTDTVSLPGDASGDEMPHGRDETQHLPDVTTDGVDDAAQVEGNESHTPLSQVKVTSVLLNGMNGEIALSTADSLEVEIEYESYADIPFCVAAIFKRNDQLMCHASKMKTSIPTLLRGKGKGRVQLYYPSVPFYHGRFFIEVLISDDLEMLLYDQIISSEITVLPMQGVHDESGLLKIDHNWRIV